MQRKYESRFVFLIDRNMIPLRL